MRRSTIQLLGAALMMCCFQGHALAQRRRAVVVQTTFGTETPIRRPVRLSRDVVRQILASDPDGVQTCIEHAGESAAEIARGLVGSSIDINGDGVLDLVAQAASSRCFMGAHSTTFWVFSKAETRLAPGYDLTLTSGADYLAVLRKKTNGFRDIETGNHTAVEMYTTVWKFDGEKYQPRECAVETFRTRKKVRVLCQR